MILKGSWRLVGLYVGIWNVPNDSCSRKRVLHSACDGFLSGTLTGTSGRTHGGAYDVNGRRGRWGSIMDD